MPCQGVARAFGREASTPRNSARGSTSGWSFEATIDTQSDRPGLATGAVALSGWSGSTVSGQDG